jgi:hypothetical protein
MTHPPRAQENQNLQADTAALGTSPMPSTGSQEMSARGLSEEQMRVLDCLQATDGALSLKQLQSHLSCYSPDDLRSAVDGLVEGHLLCELNTVIPSYACRYPGIRLYGE